MTDIRLDGIKKVFQLIANDTVASSDGFIRTKSNLKAPKMEEKHITFANLKRFFERRLVEIAPEEFDKLFVEKEVVTVMNMRHDHRDSFKRATLSNDSQPGDIDHFHLKTIDYELFKGLMFEKNQDPVQTFTAKSFMPFEIYYLRDDDVISEEARSKRNSPDNSDSDKDRENFWFKRR